MSGTASMSTEQFREFAGVVLRSLPDDLPPAVAQKWIGNGAELRKALRETLYPQSADNAFIITCEGSHSASQLVRQGNYDWVNDWITDKRFPIKKHVPVSRTIELVEFDRDPTSEEVLAEFARRGLERPTYEDALYFGIQHPEEQRRRPIGFLHEPVRNPLGDRIVLVLGGLADGRHLHLYWFGLRWHRDYAFAGVRK